MVLAFIYLQVQEHLHCTPMADESMADEFKVEESMADNTIPWRMAHGIHISYEILKYRRKRKACNIYGGEILKYRRKRST